MQPVFVEAKEPFNNSRFNAGFRRYIGSLVNMTESLYTWLEGTQHDLDTDA